MENYIEAFRKSRGLTQEELGRLISTSKGQVWKLEKGKVQLTGFWLDKLTKALGCTTDEILYGKESSLNAIDQLNLIAEEFSDSQIIKLNIEMLKKLIEEKDV